MNFNVVCIRLFMRLLLLFFCGLLKKNKKKRTRCEHYLSRSVNYVYNLLLGSLYVCVSVIINGSCLIKEICDTTESRSEIIKSIVLKLKI